MEFGEKLQQLRKMNHLTQEQLAEQLFVSRTAVSKWESGRGYPNLDSLKCISKLFSVSIDELLSNDELIELAETENRSNLRRMSGLVFAALDVIAIVSLFMPFFGQQEGASIRSVTFFEYTGMGAFLRGLYLLVLLALFIFGVLGIVWELENGEKRLQFYKCCSVVLYAVAILVFALSRQPYITAFLFLFFIIKMILIVKEIRMN